MAVHFVKKTLSEKMNDLQSLPLDKYTFTESSNYYVKNNVSGYSGIGLDSYTAKEAWSIIMEKDFDEHTLVELLNLKAGVALHTYTSEEALNAVSSL
jgi:hypothetical protein|tara:strand:- start:4001 stop:4291 length:291 start_codon:yes stop_codon:yes gene_type:complete